MINKSNGDGKPAISVIIIDSRSREHPEWVRESIDSVKEQILDDVELIVLSNTDRIRSIGQLYNQGIEEAKADWILLLGDDDFISPDYLASMKVFIEKYANEDVVICTSYTTFFDDDKRVKSINTKSPAGCYRKEYFLNHKLDETLIRHIDIDAYKRLKKDGKKMICCAWHFGYYYRQHGDQISGRKNIKPVPKN